MCKVLVEQVLAINLLECVLCYVPNPENKNAYFQVSTNLCVIIYYSPHVLEKRKSLLLQKPKLVKRCFERDIYPLNLGEPFHLHCQFH